MNPKFFYLYLIAGTVALILAIFGLIMAYPPVNLQAAVLYMVPAIVLYYLAYKVYHIKNDNELM